MARGKRSKNGVCCICGRCGPLSYEHVPPEQAFNDHGVLEADIERLIGSDFLEYLDAPTGRKNQRGSGRHTLCGRCNNNTGSWYGPAYVEFAKQAMFLSSSLPSGGRTNFAFHIQPLNFIKQVVACFCSACGPDFATLNPDLVRFVLNRTERQLPPEFRFYLSLWDRQESHSSRQSGISSRANTQTGEIDVLAEICFPPFNLIMSLSEKSPDKRLAEITFFKQFDYNSMNTIFLNLYSLPVVTWIPADFRRVSEIRPSV